MKIVVVIDVVESCKIPETAHLASTYTKLHNAIVDGVVTKIREMPPSTGPKQGDVVWGDQQTSQDQQIWHRGKLISEYEGRFYVELDANDRFGWFSVITTTDPYALKYELTAQEAKHLIIEGKTVQGSQQQRKAGYKWFDGNGIVQVNLETGSVLLARDIASTDMYAVVED